MALRFSGTGSDVPEYTDRCLRLCLFKINHRRVQVSSDSFHAEIQLPNCCDFSGLWLARLACGSAVHYKASDICVTLVSFDGFT